MPTLNSWNSNVPVEITKGGTNATSMSTATGIVKYDGTSLVTSSAAKIDSSNRMSNTAQPAFLAYVNTTINNVTGDSTVYKVIFDTEVYDQGGDFDLGTSVFTAPVTGKYLLQFSCLLNGGSTIGGANAKIITTARTYNNTMNLSPGSTQAASTNISVIADMEAGNTATFNVSGSDGGGKIDDVSGLTGGEVRTYASGYLVC